MAESPANRCRYCQGNFPEEVLRLHGGFCSPEHAEAFQAGGDRPEAEGRKEGRCQWCGQPLPLLARLKGDRFCSEWHEQQHYRRQAESFLDRVRRYRRQGGGSRLHSETAKVTIRPGSQRNDPPGAPDEPPPRQLEQRWRETSPALMLREPEPIWTLRGSIPKATRLNGQAYWREGLGDSRRRTAGNWREHGEKPPELPLKVMWRRTGRLGRGGLVLGTAPGYHASHGAREMPEPRRADCWSDSDMTQPLAAPRRCPSPRWQAAAPAPLHPAWATAIPAVTRIQPDAATAADVWREHASVRHCQAPGGVLAAAARSGLLPRAASPFTQRPHERMRVPDSPPAEWRELAGSRQQGEAHMGPLPVSHSALATRIVSHHWQFTGVLGAGWKDATPLGRHEMTAPPSGASPAAESRSWATWTVAALPAAATNSLTSSPDPGAFRLRSPGPAWTPSPPVRMAGAGEARAETGAWKERKVQDSIPALPQAGKWTAFMQSLPASGFLGESMANLPATAAIDSSKAAFEDWQGTSEKLPEPRFSSRLPVRRHPQRLSVAPHHLERTAAPGFIQTELAGATWASAGGELRFPLQPQATLERLGGAGFWPATGFVLRPPSIPLEHPEWSLEPRYHWPLALAEPAATRRAPKFAVCRTDAGIEAVKRRPDAPLTRMPEACWSPSGMTVAEAVLVPEAPVTLSFGSWWKPERGALVPGLRGRAESGWVDWGTPRWSAQGASVSDVIQPAPGRSVRVSGFGRQFAMRSVTGPVLERNVEREARGYPERLRLPHLVCRFPGTEPAAGLGRGGVGSSVFRFSGILREE